MASEHCEWEIEFVPDNPDTPQAENIRCSGTYREACEFVAEHHPDYLCREIAFHKIPTERQRNRLVQIMWLLIGAALGSVVAILILRFLIALRDGIRSGW